MDSCADGPALTAAISQETQAGEGRLLTNSTCGISGRTLGFNHSKPPRMSPPGSAVLYCILPPKRQLLVARLL